MRNIEALRDHLFATLDALRDEKKPMDIDRAKAIADVARVVVDSAKVECDHMRLTGRDGSGFIPAQHSIAQEKGTPERPRLVKGPAQP